MKRLAILFLSVLCFAIQGQAQTFTQHIQQKQPGKGNVTVTQSKEIDDLVNGNNNSTPQKTTSNQKTANNQKTAVNNQKTANSQKKNQPDTGHYIGQPKTNSQDVSAAEREKALEREQEKARDEKIAAEKAAAEKAAADRAAAKAATEKAAAEKAAEEKRRAEAQKQQNEEEEINIPTVDMRKKVMRNARKVTGYRVQAYAGGNTRADKQRAQQIGEAIKMRFPDQPIYVHFYSPRWICRVGNYRSYSEASRMLRSVKAMGYRGATIVKGKITVFE